MDGLAATVLIHTFCDTLPVRRAETPSTLAQTRSRAASPPTVAAFLHLIARPSDGDPNLKYTRFAGRIVPFDSTPSQS